jgi:hypothetical protein
VWSTSPKPSKGLIALTPPPLPKGKEGYESIYSHADLQALQDRCDRCDERVFMKFVTLESLCIAMDS